VKAKKQKIDKIKDDPVNNPKHYTFGKFEVIDVLMDWFKTEPLLWQVVKYIARCNHKGNKLQDLKKAQFYLDHQIKLVEKESTENELSRINTSTRT